MNQYQFPLPAQPFPLESCCLLCPCREYLQRLFMTNFRPVVLHEHAVFSGRLFRKRSPKDMLRIQIEHEQQQQKQQQERQQQVDQGGQHCAGPCQLPVPPAEISSVLEEAEPLPARADKDVICALVAEVMRGGHSTLIFCGGE